MAFKVEGLHSLVSLLLLAVLPQGPFRACVQCVAKAPWGARPLLTAQGQQQNPWGTGPAHLIILQGFVQHVPGCQPSLGGALGRGGRCPVPLPHSVQHVLERWGIAQGLDPVAHVLKLQQTPARAPAPAVPRPGSPWPRGQGLAREWQHKDRAGTDLSPEQVLRDTAELGKPST